MKTAMQKIKAEKEREFINEQRHMNVLRGPTQFFGNFFICGPIRTKFAQYM